MRLILRWLITAAAVAIAARFVPGIELRDSNAWIAVLATAAILGLVNAVVRPILSFLSCGLIVLTLGLFTFVINALMLWLASYIAQNYFGIGFFVDGFVPALIGSIVISVVSVVLSIFLPDDRREER